MRSQNGHFNHVFSIYSNKKAVFWTVRKTACSAQLFDSFFWSSSVRIKLRSLQKIGRCRRFRTRPAYISDFSPKWPFQAVFWTVWACTWRTTMFDSYFWIQGQNMNNLKWEKVEFDDFHIKKISGNAVSKWPFLSNLQYW